MHVKKIFAVEPKRINEKPPYVKPKHKTYRELLDLDRPKKILREESDDENDDFLQKLMKQEARKQPVQKQSQNQKKESGKLSVNNSQPKMSSKITQMSLSQKQKQNNLIQGLKSSKVPQNRPIQNLIQKSQGSKQTNAEQNNPEVMKNESESIQKKTKQEKSNRKLVTIVRKRKFSESSLKVPSQAKANSNAIQKAPEFLKGKSVSYNFISTFNTKSFAGILELKKQTHKNKDTAQNQNGCLIETELNRLKKDVCHKVSPQKPKFQTCYAQRANQFLLKNAMEPPVQLMFRTNGAKHGRESSKSFKRRNELFKTSYQEELFLKSLKKQLNY